jgi:hypothetical protein
MEILESRRLLSSSEGSSSVQTASSIQRGRLIGSVGVVGLVVCERRTGDYVMDIWDWFILR